MFSSGVGPLTQKVQFSSFVPKTVILAKCKKKKKAQTPVGVSAFENSYADCLFQILKIELRSQLQ